MVAGQAFAVACLVLGFWLGATAMKWAYEEKN